MITQDFVKEWFSYADGILYWRIKPARKILVGQPAGRMNTQGYFQTQINKQRYYNHRIIFLMHNGYLPELIDHIDGDRANNRIENLRPITNQQNQHNSKTPVTNTSGVKGVRWCDKYGKWVARIKIDRVLKHIGYFTDLDAAAEAVRVARLNLHKEYANHG